LSFVGDTGETARRRWRDGLARTPSSSLAHSNNSIPRQKRPSFAQAPKLSSGPNRAATVREREQFQQYRSLTVAGRFGLLLPTAPAVGRQGERFTPGKCGNSVQPDMPEGHARNPRGETPRREKILSPFLKSRCGRMRKRADFF